MKLAVVALGGNALQKRGEPVTVEGQVRDARPFTQAVCKRCTSPKCSHLIYSLDRGSEPTDAPPRSPPHPINIREAPVLLVPQARNARDAAQSLAALVHQEGVRLCVTHGNGPQVGRLAEQVRRCRCRCCQHRSVWPSVRSGLCAV